MAYDLHVARTRNWMDSASDPIALSDVEALIKADPELSWSATDYIENAEGSRVPVIEWRGASSFWLERGQIICSGPSDDQAKKLVKIAAALGAYAVGDDGELYGLQQSSGGVESLVTRNDDV